MSKEIMLRFLGEIEFINSEHDDSLRPENMVKKCFSTATADAPFGTHVYNHEWTCTKCWKAYADSWLMPTVYSPLQSESRGD